MSSSANNKATSIKSKKANAATAENSRNTAKSKKEQKRLKQQKLIKTGGIASAIIIFFVWFVNSSFWPWPSSAEISRRLNEVIDSCMYNERSRGCSILQEKYDMSFEYCHSYVDIPEIEKSIPVYGVAKRNKGSFNKYPYYSCSTYLEDVDKSNVDNLLASEPTSLALYELYETPKKGTSGNYYKCEANQLVAYGEIWDQIPNIEAIKNEYRIAIDSNNKCDQLSNLQKEFDRINKKLSNYSSNKTVQKYYRQYDIWLGSDDLDNIKNGSYTGLVSSCEYGDKRFYQKCTNDEYDLNHFVMAMRKTITTDDYTSKLVIE